MSSEKKTVFTRETSSLYRYNIKHHIYNMIYKIHNKNSYLNSRPLMKSIHMSHSPQSNPILYLSADSYLIRKNMQFFTDLSKPVKH